MVACLNRSVTVKARPSTVDDLTLASPATTDGAATAICTSDGGKPAGTSDMTIMQAVNDRGQPERIMRTDLSMHLAALGGGGAPPEVDESGGFDPPLKADAFFVDTMSEASRMRLALEGSRAFRVGGGVRYRRTTGSGGTSQPLRLRDVCRQAPARPRRAPPPQRRNRSRRLLHDRRVQAWTSLWNPLNVI